MILSDIIPKLTKDCDREDCAVTYEGASITCMGWAQTYDKRGNLTARDPNISTSGFHCSKCGTKWTVRSQLGNDTIECFKP